MTEQTKPNRGEALSTWVRASEEFSSWSWWSPICPTYSCSLFSHAPWSWLSAPRLSTYSHILPLKLWGKDAFDFHLGGGGYFWLGMPLPSFLLSAMCNLFPPTPRSSDKALLYGKRKKKKMTLSFIFSCSCLCFAFTNTVFFLLDRKTQVCSLWWKCLMCHPVSGVFLSVSGQQCHSAHFELQHRELWKPAANKRRDSFPSSCSQMPNLSRTLITLYDYLKAKRKINKSASWSLRGPITSCVEGGGNKWKETLRRMDNN